jgi:hypothetical protein
MPRVLAEPQGQGDQRRAGRLADPTGPPIFLAPGPAETASLPYANLREIAPQTPFEGMP